MDATRTCGITNKQGEHSNEERILLAPIKKFVTLALPSSFVVMFHQIQTHCEYANISKTENDLHL